MEYTPVFAQEVINRSLRDPRRWRHLFLVRCLVLAISLAQPVAAIGAPPGQGDDAAASESHTHGDKEVSFDDLPVGAIAWKKWDCPVCGRKGNLAKPDASGHQSCAGCGKPRTPGIPDYLDGAGPAGKQNVTAEALAGPDTVKHAESGKQIPCPHCGKLNFRSVEHCTGCGASVREEPKRLPPPQQPPPQSSLPCNWRVLAAIGGAVTAGVGVLVWGLSTKERDGEIVEANWEHDVELQRFQRVQRSGFLHQLQEEAPVMPAAGVEPRGGVQNIRNARQELFEKKRVQTGVEHYLEPETYTVTERRKVTETYQEPYKDYEWKDLGNGAVKKVEVTKYRTKTRDVVKDVPVEKTRMVPKTRPVYTDVPVMKTYVDYDTYEWVTVDKKSASGSSFDRGTTALPWPEFPVGSNERTVRHEKYGVVVEYDGKRTPKEIKDEAELLRWNVGGKAKVTRSNFGEVRDVEPK